MKFETEFIEKMIDKYGSRKSLIILAGMGVLYSMPIPEMLEPAMQSYVTIAKIAGVTILGVLGVLAQLKLDKAEETP